MHATKWNLSIFRYINVSSMRLKISIMGQESNYKEGEFEIFYAELDTLAEATESHNLMQVCVGD